MTQYGKLDFFLSSTFFVLSIFSFAFAQESTMVAGAKAEGRVVWYSGSGLALAQSLSNAFEKKYPFLKVDLIRSSDERMLNRITAEKQTGKVFFDVVNSQLIPMMQRLNLIASYSPPGAELIHPKYKDVNGYWTALHIDYYSLSYNTKLLRGEYVPHDWWDLLDARWKGKIGLDPEEFAWTGAMVEYLGEEKARKLLTGLARQEIRWHKGHTQLAQLMAAGEFEIALAYAHRIEDMKKKGAPVGWVNSTKPIIAGLQKVGLSAAAPHPNAAHLLVNFLISKEGQTEVYHQGYNPAYPAILPKDSPLNPVDLEIHPISAKITQDLNRYVKQFDQIFGPRR